MLIGVQCQHLCIMLDMYKGWGAEVITAKCGVAFLDGSLG